MDDKDALLRITYCLQSIVSGYLLCYFYFHKDPILFTCSAALVFYSLAAAALDVYRW